MKLARTLALALALTPAFAGQPGSTTITAANQHKYTEGRKHAMVRRVVSVAACGLSMWDFAQTANHVGHGGIVEGNPLLANANGTANLGMMAGAKIGMCAAPFVLGELGAHWHSSALTNAGLIGSIGDAAVSSAVVTHNESVLAGRETK